MERRIIRWCVVLFLPMVLAGCLFGDPRQMTLSMSAYTDRPVVVTDMTINGEAMPLIPAVVRGRADVTRPSSGMGRRLIAYPSGNPGEMALDVTWVELPGGHAFTAQVVVPLDRLEPSASGGVEVMPVFVPGGALIVASDPVPRDADDRTINDVVKLCGTRAPAADTDFASDPRSLPGLFEALESAVPAGPEPEPCPW